MEKFRQALADTRSRYDYILEEHETREFVEIIGSIGGDVERVRVYRDGNVYAK